MSTEPENKATEEEEGFNKNLIDTLITFAVNGSAWSIYKSYVEDNDLGEDFFNNLYNDDLGLRLDPGKVEMIKVMVQEAIDHGYIEDNIDDSAFGIGVPMLMVTLTEKGRLHIKEQTRQSFIDHFQGIIDYITDKAK